MKNEGSYIVANMISIFLSGIAIGLAVATIILE